MLYVLVLVVVTAAIAGILPALHATRRRGGADLRQLGGSTGMRLGRMWSALIVVQVAFAVAVLPAAIKMGVKEIRHSFTRPSYPVEEFVNVGVSTESGSTSLRQSAAGSEAPLAGRARGGRRDVYRVAGPARQDRTHRSRRRRGGRRSRPTVR